MVLTVLFSSCLNGIGNGTNTLIKETFNAKHDRKAILFLKQSTLSSDSYQVTVSNDEYKLGEEDVGNTFTVDTNHDSTFLDSTSINLSWLNNNTLQIDYDKALRTFIQEQKVGGVTVVYKVR